MASRSSKKTPVLLGLIQLMRPRQWIKNGFVLAPLLFTGEFLNSLAIQEALGVFILFCFASSIVYIINDIHDIEDDAKHPKKSLTRPLAAGIVKIPQAIILAIILLAIILLGCVLMPLLTWVIAGYICLNLAYTFVLKHQPVIDIFSIAIGFVLRVYAGAIALSVPVSSWMFVTTLCLALYLAAIKRRQELINSGSDGRKVLKQYTVSLVNRYAEMSATGALIFYSLFVISTKPALVITIPFVLFGLYRYWFVVESLEGGESPTDALLTDWQLAAVVVLWIATCLWKIWPT